MTASLEGFQAGDLVTIAGVYADGTREANDTLRAQYRNAPLKRFRVAARPAERDGVWSMQLVDDDTQTA